LIQWAWPGLQVGDRLPDLRAPLADGSVFVPSEDAGGMPIALVVAELPPDVSVGALVVHVARPDATPDPSRLSLDDDGRIAWVLTGGVDGVVVAGPEVARSYRSRASRGTKSARCLHRRAPAMLSTAILRSLPIGSLRP
jgi:hypothetical protein